MAEHCSHQADEVADEASRFALWNRLRRLPPQVGVWVFVVVVLALSIMGIISGGSRWAVLSPPIGPRNSLMLEISRGLGPVEEAAKQRDREVEELTGDVKK
jgi:hypothetical protein